MANSMLQPAHEALLNSVRKPDAAKAKLDANSVSSSSRMLRLAIARSGLSQKEAQDALGVEHKGDFSEMLDGKRKLWMHQLLRKEAAAIWKELLVIAALEAGCEVERVVRIKGACMTEPLRFLPYEAETAVYRHLYLKGVPIQHLAPDFVTYWVKRGRTAEEIWAIATGRDARKES